MGGWGDPTYIRHTQISVYSCAHRAVSATAVASPSLAAWGTACTGWLLVGLVFSGEGAGRLLVYLWGRYHSHVKHNHTYQRVCAAGLDGNKLAVYKQRWDVSWCAMTDERKPSVRWSRNARGQLSLSCGSFECLVTKDYVDSTRRWRIDSCGGDNRHDGGWSDTEENAQFSAEDALRALLTEALAELDGGR